MIERPMPQDIMEFKPKIMAGLTARQLIWGFVSGLITIIAYLTYGKSMGMGPLTIALCAVPAIPTALIGFVPIMGQPFEKVAVQVVIDNFIAPPIRKKEIHFPEYEKWRKLNYDELEELKKKIIEDKAKQEQEAKEEEAAKASGKKIKKKKLTKAEIKAQAKAEKEEAKKQKKKKAFVVKPSKEFVAIK